MTATETKEFTLPFVGREEELQFLLDEYDQMLHAQYRSVWIEAPAGMGKTTLVEEFLRRITGETSEVFKTSEVLRPWIVHAHLRERSSNSLASFVEALGVTLQTLTEAQREKLFSGLTSFYKERAKKIVGGANVQSMDMEEAITTVGYVLKQLSKYFPLIVIIEDIHVLKGEMSFYALRHLQAIMEQVPVLTMFISRPSEEKYLKQFQELSMKEGCEKYEVKSLKYEDVEKLVGPERSDANKLMHLSGGNALLLRELLRSGTLDTKDSSASTTEQIIHYLIKELEQLPKRDRQLIAIAGMLGEEFSEQLLHEITASNDFRCWSDNVLRRLEQKGIINRRKKILKPEGEGKEISLRVSVFCHALWWEAARKQFLKEKKEAQWSDKKFSETIVSLLSHEDYPLLTDAELLIRLLKSVPETKAVALLKYIDSFLSLGGKWHFHSHAEQVEILELVRACIVSLHSVWGNFKLQDVEVMVHLLEVQRFILGSKAFIGGNFGEIAIVEGLLKRFITSDPGALYNMMGAYGVEASFYLEHADMKGLRRVYKKVKKVQSIYHSGNSAWEEAQQHCESVISSVDAHKEYFVNPTKAASLLYRAATNERGDRDESIHFAAICLLSLPNMEIPQSLVKDALAFAKMLSNQSRRFAKLDFVKRRVQQAFARLSLKAGEILNGSAVSKELQQNLQGIWRLSEGLKIMVAVLHSYSYEYDDDKADQLINEILSEKYSSIEADMKFMGINKQLFMLEKWEQYEKLWHGQKEGLLLNGIPYVVPLLERRLMMCLLTSDSKGIEEALSFFKKTLKKYPVLKNTVEITMRRANLFLRLKSKRLPQAKKNFDRYLSTSDTLSLFDRAHLAQLFARIGVQYGHAPKEFSSYVDYSLKEFARLGINKRVVFTAEKFYEAKLISEKELYRIKKKYKIHEARHDAKSVSHDQEETMKYERRSTKDEQGITLRCIGGIEAFYPNDKEIVDRWWGKQKPIPSYHKRIVMELVCARLERRSVAREELLAILDPSVERGTISGKKKARLDRALAACLSQIKKMFLPYNIIEKISEGYRLDSSVDVDLLAIQDSYTKLKELARIHPPSAHWQIMKLKNLLKIEIAPGIRSKKVERMKQEFKETRNNYLALEKSLQARTVL